MEEISNGIMDYFATKPYDDNKISEEEFIYDSLNNSTLFGLLKNSLKTFAYDVHEDPEPDDHWGLKYLNSIEKLLDSMKLSSTYLFLVK